MGGTGAVAHRGSMTSLHISHTVRDFDKWLAAFKSHAGFRADGGVAALTLRRGVDDPDVVAVDLEFDTTDQARSFLARLQSEIWPDSPHFDGTPTSVLLDAVTASV